jgi:hypothetical protein
MTYEQCTAKMAECEAMARQARALGDRLALEQLAELYKRLRDQPAAKEGRWAVQPNGILVSIDETTFRACDLSFRPLEAIMNFHREKGLALAWLLLFVLLTGGAVYDRLSGPSPHVQTAAK